MSAIRDGTSGSFVLSLTTALTIDEKIGLEKSGSDQTSKKWIFESGNL